MSTPASGIEHDPFATAQAAATELARLGGRNAHDLFVVLGSGWARVAESLPAGIDILMTDLPGFPAPSAIGHAGSFRSVEIDGLRVLLALGRVHLYEGHSANVVAHAVRMAAAAGCTTAIFTNAAGVLDREQPLGRPVVISDHINLTGCSPLTGLDPRPPMQGRFTDMSAVYTPELRRLVHELEPGLREGVYVGWRGPQYETPAEVNMSRIIGGSLVGMSTVIESIAASHLGMRILGLSLATNLAAGLGDGRLDGDHVVAVANANAPFVADLLHRIIATLAQRRHLLV